MQVTDMSLSARPGEVPGRGEDRLLRTAAGAGGDSHVEDMCGARIGQGVGG
jgi:hypothetical protein